MCLSLFDLSVQKQPSSSESRPKLIRAAGPTKPALATAPWLTRIDLPATLMSTGWVPVAGPTREPEPMVTVPVTLIQVPGCVVMIALRPILMSQNVYPPESSTSVAPFMTRRGPYVPGASGPSVCPGDTCTRSVPHAIGGREQNGVMIGRTGTPVPLRATARELITGVFASTCETLEPTPMITVSPMTAVPSGIVTSL